MVNASPLISLGKVDRPDLLVRAIVGRWYRLYTTWYEELQIGDLFG